MIAKNNKVKSPLNYTGNKYRTLDQMQVYFPNEIHVMVDLFCGGATVGLNTECDKVIFIDKNEHVIELLKFLAKSDFDSLMKSLEKIITEYGLSYSAKYGYSQYSKQINDVNRNNGLKQYNRPGYMRLRSDYNSLKNKHTDRANIMLYMLMVYGFNNDIRFSQNDEFNLPAGKTDLNKFNIQKLHDYIQRISEIDAEFICGDFTDDKIQEIIKSADFVYMDPPYLIMDAVYNESGQWTEEDEYKLLDLLDYFIDNNKHFVLSNVLEKKGKRNEPLYYWTMKKENKVKIVDIDYHYRGANYHKKVRDAQEREVIIIPGDEND